MKHIFVNLKRFDVPESYGGVNGLFPVSNWGRQIVAQTQEALKEFASSEIEFVQFFPEAHLLSTLETLEPASCLQIGCQGVCRRDTAPGGEFGALTGARPASVVRAMGCSWALVGHCEERRELVDVLNEGLCGDFEAVDRLLNQEARRTVERGLKVLYCIGETEDQQGCWREVLGRQLALGLAGLDPSQVVIAYEPVWSIGPRKTPADKPYITKVARFIKERTGGADVVYGGGLKLDNARMLASIPEIDGGLIALTRFQGKIGFYPSEYLEIVRLYVTAISGGIR